MQKAAVDTKRAIEATNRLAEAAKEQVIEARRLADEAKRSADTAVDTEQRGLRAYLGVDNTALHCPLCLTVNPNKPFELPAEHLLNNVAVVYWHNGGRTPAYNVRGRGMFWETALGQQLPNGFGYPESLSSNPIPIGTMTFNPGQRHPVHFVIGADEIFRLGRAREHHATVFFYGHLDYIDVFGVDRSTPFCFEYLPDHPDDQFRNCPDHNTPERDR
jgi:hypothetical protein